MICLRKAGLYSCVRTCSLTVLCHLHAHTHADTHTHALGAGRDGSIHQRSSHAAGGGFEEEVSSLSLMVLLLLSLSSITLSVTPHLSLLIRYSSSITPHSSFVTLQPLKLVAVLPDSSPIVFLSSPFTPSLHLCICRHLFAAVCSHLLLSHSRLPPFCVSCLLLHGYRRMQSPLSI